MNHCLDKDVEVLYFTNPIENCNTNSLRNFDGKKFISTSKEDIKFNYKDKEKDLVQRRAKAKSKKRMWLTNWPKYMYGCDVITVSIHKHIQCPPPYPCHNLHVWVWKIFQKWFRYAYACIPLRILQERHVVFAHYLDHPMQYFYCGSHVRIYLLNVRLPIFVSNIYTNCCRTLALNVPSYKDCIYLHAEGG